jgi:hypothetical protein
MKRYPREDRTRSEGRTSREEPSSLAFLDLFSLLSLLASMEGRRSLLGEMRDWQRSVELVEREQNKSLGRSSTTLDRTGSCWHEIAQTRL